MMASSAAASVAFHRVDPETLCLACLHEHSAPGGCPACGFDERTAVASPLHLPPRTILHGQYLVGRALGQGGFGITYLAWDLNLEMPVAIKEFLPTDFASRASAQLSVTPYGEDGAANFDRGLDAFEGEARTLARCNALPGVVDVLNYFRENGTAYIVMHYLRGRTMREHLRARNTPLPFAEAAAIIRPVLEALREVHRLGLVHRDISPDNIYICDANRVCLLDFGAARNAVRDRSKSLSVQFKVGYTPEEQYRRHGAQGPWTDVYAAAATFYRALTGLTPPPSLDRLTLDQLRPPGALGITMPRHAERALMRALAVQASRRYHTVDEFLDELALPAAAVHINANVDRSIAHPAARPDDRGTGRDDVVGDAAMSAPHGGARGATSGAVLRDAALYDARRGDDGRGTPGRENADRDAAERGGFGRHVAGRGARVRDAGGPSLVAVWRALLDTLTDTGRLARLWIDAALVRARAGLASARAAGTAGRERAIREQLAALWPVTLVDVTLRAPHLPAGPDHGPLDVYARDDTTSIAFGVVLQSNYAGIRPLTGSLSVSVIRPRIDARIGTRTNQPTDGSSALELPAPDFVDRVALEGTWAPDDGFDAGVWRFDFLWDGRKIGEREFVVSA